jgi:hypothetical protein
MERWNDGILEWWRLGSPKFQFSNIPFFQFLLPSSLAYSFTSSQVLSGLYSFIVAATEAVFFPKSF